jgi:hypothetical protein
LQAPHFVGSELKLTHFVSHASGAGATQLDEHTYVDPDAEQSAVGAAQALPQAPQFACVLRLVSHPSSPRVEQCAYPAAQAEAGTLQTPDWQVIPVAPGATLCNAVQSCPQMPQFSGSDIKFAHVVLHVFGIDIGHVARHCVPLDPAPHFGAAAPHLVVQLPQVLASTREVSQPSSARDEQ